MKFEPFATRRRLFTFLGLSALLLGCESNQSSGQEPEPSPIVNADLVPAPVDPEAVKGSASPDLAAKPQRERAEPTAHPFELQRAAETTEPTETDVLDIGPLFTLEAHWALPGQTVPGFNGLEDQALEAARAKTTTNHVIDLLPSGHMRLALVGGAFSLNPGSQILARADRTGWLLSWPGLTQYRALPPGSLLAVLREARADMAPLIAPRIENERALKERRFGFSVTRTLLTTNRGSLTLDQVDVPDAGRGGVAVCRMLIELLAAIPTASPCDGRGIAIRAHFEYPGATLDWIVDSLKQRTEGFDPIEVPPRGASFVADGLPTESRALLGSAELATLRKSERRGRVAVANRDSVGAFLTLDGAPVAFIAPRKTLQVDLPQGELRLGVRDFLGAELQPTKPLKLEAKADIAWREPDDAGAPRPPAPR